LLRRNAAFYQVEFAARLIVTRKPGVPVGAAGTQDRPLKVKMSWGNQPRKPLVPVACLVDGKPVHKEIRFGR
jgi:hypothetical protein